MDNYGEDSTKAILQSFSNLKDIDIQSFLRDKAIDYNKRKWCYTYLIVQSDMLEHNGEVIVEGYFTLSNKVIGLDSNVSNTTKKKLFFGLKMDDTSLPCILIGQLGKYIGEDRVSSIDMDEILDYAMDIIEQINHLFAFSCVLLEYEPSRTGLRDKYEKYKFKELQRTDGFVQMFYIL